jgi:hypothetical protein
MSRRYLESLQQAPTSEIEALIGQQLKLFYEPQTTPDRLAELLKQLVKRIDERGSESK